MITTIRVLGGFIKGTVVLEFVQNGTFDNADTWLPNPPAPAWEIYGATARAPSAGATWYAPMVAPLDVSEDFVLRVDLLANPNSGQLYVTIATDGGVVIQELLVTDVVDSHEITFTASANHTHVAIYSSEPGMIVDNISITHAP